MTQTVALNAIKYIKIRDTTALRKKSKSPTAVTLIRTKLPPIKFALCDDDDIKPLYALMDGPPTKPPSKLPQPGDMHVHLSIRQPMLGYGRSGSVFAVDVFSEAHGDLQKPDTGFGGLPELVLKISRGENPSSLAIEAAFYDEMESIQGIAIPRCYGLFEAECDIDWLADVDDAVDMSDSTASTETSNGTSTKKPLFALLLERLGGKIPLDTKENVSADDQKDLFDIYEDLTILGIQHNDVRHPNILFQPSPLVNTPNSFCPTHKVHHRYRIIDFESATKTDLLPNINVSDTEDILGRLLDNIKTGHTIEPAQPRDFW